MMKGLTTSTSCTEFLATQATSCSAQQLDKANIVLRRPVEGNKDAYSDVVRIADGVQVSHQQGMPISFAAAVAFHITFTSSANANAYV